MGKNETKEKNDALRFSEIVKKVMNLLIKNQRELAHDLGITTVTMSRCTNGYLKPNTEILMRLLEIVCQEIEVKENALEEKKKEEKKQDEEKCTKEVLSKIFKDEKMAEVVFALIKN